MSKLYIRLCPKCKTEITYKERKGLNAAERKGATCLGCRPFKTKLAIIERIGEKPTRAEYSREYRKQHAANLKIAKQKYVEKIRKLVFEHYGNKCACCGESNTKFLTLDHINGRWENGIKDRTTGKKLYGKVYKLKFPNTFQLLCYNCNCAKGVYGECPHKSDENGLPN